PEQRRPTALVCVPPQDSVRCPCTESPVRPTSEVAMPAAEHDNQAPPCPVAPAEPRSAEQADKDSEKVALPPAFREVTLTTEEAETIRAVLDDPARPAHTGAEMPTADPSFLLGNGR